MSAAEAIVAPATPAGRSGAASCAVSLFSGAGGLDLGLSQAGWHVLAQIEMDPASVESLRSHQSESEPIAVFPRRVEEVDPRRLRLALELGRGDLGLLAGGPPCQPFTTHGRRRALLDARAVSAFPTYLDYVREFRPQALLMENVDGLISAALQHRPLLDRGKDAAPIRLDEMKGSFLRWLLQELADLGYAVSWGVAEAADYGVPQMRQRAILLGVRGAEPCFLPVPTHGPCGDTPYITVREALRDVSTSSPVQPLSARKRAVYELIAPGGNWRDLPEALQRETMGQAYYATGGRSGWWRRLSWDSPAPTILGMPDHSSTALIHPDELRCLSVAECAALQTFPPATVFGGQPRSQYQQIGNAVPPKLGAAVGGQLRRFLEGEHRPEPQRPAWRRASSNRRIGTHGWVHESAAGETLYRLHVRVRPDHVWSVVAGVERSED